MKQVLLNRGMAVVEDVPVPMVDDNTLLIRVDHSCISIGTELSGLKMSGAPLWKRALKQPENVKKVLKMVATSGLSKTHSLVKGQLEAGNATGYSAAGTVVAVGRNIVRFKEGDRVACAGAQCAHHAEYISVPENLTVLLSDTLSFAEASTVTLGAIALQGVRRATPTLGECFAVIGLGILGQITVQLLKANGCRVIGIDLDEERIKLAQSLGMDGGFLPEHGDVIEYAQRLTHGIGVDGVIITAATPSNEVISTAFNLCRKKGRVVLVGDVGLDLKRSDFYQKEIDFFISSSYGPGRYDRHYEEEGMDYPVAYVRWTENRNMEEYVRLLSEKKISIIPLIGATYPIEQASRAYQQLKDENKKPLMVLLNYPYNDDIILRTIPNPLAVKSAEKKICLAVVGAGGFAKGMHLPNLAKLTDRFSIHSIVSRTGHNAIATAKQFAAQYGSTDYNEILLDPETDAILLSTRHHLHAQMVLQGLKAKKHILVEKPLALTTQELNSIVDFYKENETQNPPILLTGFNRRFSPIISKMKELVNFRTNPMMLTYRMNAGYIPLDHWVHGPEGGGRNLGEACHIYDLFTYLTDSTVVSIDTQSITPTTGYYSRNDNFIVTLSFADGSIATLAYTALGAKNHPKEQLEIFVDGKVLIMNDYKSLQAVGTKIKSIQHPFPEKGQMEELIAFADGINKGIWPIPLWHQIQATEISLIVEQQLNQTGKLRAEVV